MPNLLQQINTSAAAISTRALSSLVQIRVGERSLGAGAIWRADGLIITNAHVVLAGRGRLVSSLSVRLHDGREFTPRVVAVDAARDLAALQIDAHDLPAVTVGESRRLQPGDLVMALGFPWGIHGGATTGVVIGVGDNLPELGDRRRDWLAAALHLRPGHSGGPMLDSQGRLVGINTLMNGPEVGVAVPVHVVQNFLATHQPHAPQPAARPDTGDTVHL